MDATDRRIMSHDFGSDPVHIDAGEISWCHRPRLYWTTWDLRKGIGATCDLSGEVTVWHLVAEQPVEEVLEPGWTKAVLSKPFPTFTTARPSVQPGRKPAGIAHCSEEELSRWRCDLHRFPPYQYQQVHSVVNKKGHLRVPSVAEREVM